MLSLGSKTLPQDKIGLEIEARDVQVTTLLDQHFSVTGLNNIGQHGTTWKRDISNKPTSLYEHDENDYGIPEVSDGHVGWERERDNNLTR